MKSCGNGGLWCRACKSELDWCAAAGQVITETGFWAWFYSYHFFDGIGFGGAVVG